MRKKNYRRPLSNKKGREIILTSRSGKKRCNLQKNMKRLACNRALNLEHLSDCNTISYKKFCPVTSVKVKIESLISAHVGATDRISFHQRVVSILD